MTYFSTMSKNKLRAYLIKHPDNKSAFEAFVDRFTSDADSTIYPAPESPKEIEKVNNLIQQKLAQTKKS